ncbi:3-hydroxyacyl-CoA dehydrogenase / 3-hydroxy-2-methylbutyryl-CoA dehydrogenase [Clonorchis sinensis]|uniref:3-hydroxyacyl-CoA dehydrogenase / 3-hydroxy-2-methylbutyryl-CoA dehydrogenase n=1 Tax=Clonorchis sinensis TaxID=79923 RepID=G7YVD3_CLOSI|nr:3-hydroxyacyl-CoA dehydrogenase / 3-hydroxy-2-methylbutyryl-CoA dehydrogenase [Clonorchis sinensis]
MSFSCAAQLFQVTCETDAINAVNTAKGQFSKLDVLVNCAGVGFACKTFNAKHRKPHALDTFERIIKVSFDATVSVFLWTSVACQRDRQ